ncbi:MAG: RNA polymerase sigma factor [Acidobacteriota bacterium]
MKREGETVDVRADFWEHLGPCKQKLYNYIQKVLNFSVDADDVFQDAVLRAFQYYGSYKVEKKFSTWLFAIAHNEMRKHLRKASRSAAQLNPDLAHVQVTGENQETVREIYRLAERLKPRQREVFFLLYDTGFTVEEISRITGLKKGNIKFILNQARNSLRAFFGERDGR